MAKYVNSVHIGMHLRVANYLVSPNRIKKEEDRLKKNKERRQQREKQRGGGRTQPATTLGGGDAAMSPDAEPSIERGGTTRKCANCGQVGHIKTNKKYVPNNLLTSQSAPSWQRCFLVSRSSGLFG